jgi:integrase
VIGLAQVAQLISDSSPMLTPVTTSPLFHSFVYSGSVRYVLAMNPGDAIDLYIGFLAREGRRPSTLNSYRRILNDFADTLGTRCMHEVEITDYERFLNRWVGAEPSTLASGISCVKGFSYFVYDRGYTAEHVAERIRRPRKKRPEDLNVVTISHEDVFKLFSGCESLQELLCIATAAYLGPRRAAISKARRHDVDLVAGTIRFEEKGGKVITKPMPDEYMALLQYAEREGTWPNPDDYLVPSRRPNAVRRGERSDKVIWETVRIVAARAGVKAHVHAIRAAFAVAFDEVHPDKVTALKELMGHTRIETTMVYLRRKNKAKAMEAVRTLSWADSVFEPGIQKTADLQDKAHTGFEPVPPPFALPDSICRKLAEFMAHNRTQGKESECT